MRSQVVEWCRAVSCEMLTFLKRKLLQWWLHEVSNCIITGYRGQVHLDKGMEVLGCPEGIRRCPEDVRRVQSGQGDMGSHAYDTLLFNNHHHFSPHLSFVL